VRFDPETSTVHAAGRTWHADPARTSITDLRGGDLRYVHRTRRCVIPFESGWSASILWGCGSYSSNHDAWLADDPFTEEPDTVEVGVLDHTGELRVREETEGDLTWHSVESYLDDDALAELLDQLAKLPTDYDYGARPATLDEMRADYERLRQASAELGRELPPWPGEEIDG